MRRNTYSILYNDISDNLGISVAQSKRLVKKFGERIIEITLAEGSCAIKGLGSMYLSSKKYKACLRGKQTEGEYYTITLGLAHPLRLRLKKLLQSEQLQKS